MMPYVHFSARRYGLHAKYWPCKPVGAKWSESQTVRSISTMQIWLVYMLHLEHTSFEMSMSYAANYSCTCIQGSSLGRAILKEAQMEESVFPCRDSTCTLCSNLNRAKVRHRFGLPINQLNNLCSPQLSTLLIRVIKLWKLTWSRAQQSHRSVLKKHTFSISMKGNASTC